MRRTEVTAQFKRDYKKEQRGIHKKRIQAGDSELTIVLKLLVNNQPLPEKYKDHALHGNYNDCRDCHIAPDLILIYRQVSNDILQLVRLGAHSELF